MSDPKKSAIEWIRELVVKPVEPVVDGVITEVFEKSVTVRLVGQDTSRVKRGVQIPEHIDHSMLIIGGAVTLTVKQGKPVLVNVYDRLSKGKLLPPPKLNVKYSSDGQNFIVTWPAVKGATHYKVFCNSDPMAKNATSLGQTEETIFSEPVSPCVWFSAKTCDGSVCSGYSAWVTVSKAPGANPVPPPGIGNSLWIADGDLYRLNDDWGKQTGESVWAECDPAANISSNPDGVTLIAGGLGSIKRSTDGGATWGDITPTIAPPNKWGDSPAPTIADLTFAILRGDKDADGRWHAVARWQASGNWRSLLLWTDDNGENWWWVDWWLAGGLSADDVIGAYQAVGAETLADSYVNLNEPGTNDLTVGVPPILSANDGWVSDSTKYLLCDVGSTTPSTIVGATGIAIHDPPIIRSSLLGAGSGWFDRSAIKDFFEMGGPKFGVSTSVTSCSNVAASVNLDRDVLSICLRGDGYYWSYTLSEDSFDYSINCVDPSTTIYSLFGTYNAGTLYGGIVANIQAVAFYSPTFLFSDEQVRAIAAHIHKLQEVYS